MKKMILLASIAWVFTSGCTSKKSESPTGQPADPVAVPTLDPQMAKDLGAGFAQLAPNTQAQRELRVGISADGMRFDPSRLQAKPGEVLRVVFQNRSSQNSARRINWILVKPGQQGTVRAAALNAGPSAGFHPESPVVIAAMKGVNPNEVDSVVFRVPEIGEYPFVNTIPGGNFLEGVLVSQP